ncbi:MAG: hypothetical protein M1118_05345 [Chloroflexi bacterium]|nr:hypothetical protein [Chloroflexota bacterium]
MSRTVLEVVLDQLDIAPAEYFDRLAKGLEEWKSERSGIPLVSAREAEAIAQEEAAQLETFPYAGEEEPVDFPMFEEGLPEASTSAGRSRPTRRPTRARANRFLDEPEEDVGEFVGFSEFEEDLPPTRGPRRSLRTSRRSPRER